MHESSERDDGGREARVAHSRRWLGRYEPLLDDAVSFESALAEHPPLDLLVLPARTTRERVAESLTARGLAVRTFPAAPHHLRVTGHVGAGTLPEVVLGFAFPQGVVSAIGPQALSPAAGERVLDMCAAPGGKTVLLDALGGGGAAILAGEPSVGRAGILVQTLSRCGAASVIVVRQDGCGFPAVGPFDAILLDAPCTGEGTFRFPSPRYEPRDEKGLADASRLQGRLLRRALDLLAPGGRLIYSTCAYAPEENEAVLDDVLRERDDVMIADLPPGTPGLPALSGANAWLGRPFHDSLSRARRIFPHHLGSWGFFIALLRKDPDSTRCAKPRTRYGAAPASTPVDDPEARRNVIEHLRERFDVDPALFDDRIVTRRGRDDFGMPAIAGGWELSRLDLVTPGLRLVHRAGRGLQPTNAALRWLGSHLRDNIVDIDLATAQTALEQNDGAIVDGVAGEDRHLAAVRVDGVVVSKGHLKDGRLTLEIPAGWR